MRNLADHLFDIIENSVNANATDVIVKLSFSEKKFFCSISDNGSGISGPEVLDPFVTSRKTRRVGLGLPLLKKAAEDTGGYLKIDKLTKTGGTYLEFQMDMSHIDAKPFGNLARTFSDIFIAWPMINLKLFIKEGSLEELIIDFEELRIEAKQDLCDSSATRQYIYLILQETLKAIGID